MSSLAIVVLAAGQGTRMKSRHSKLLHPLVGRPLVAYALRLAEAMQPAHLLLVLGHHAQEVEEALGPGYNYVLQEPQLGTGHAVQQVQPLLEGKCDEVLVLYGDTPLLRLQTIQDMVRRHRAEGAVVTLLTGVVADPYGYGRVVRDTVGRVLAVVEETDATAAERRIGEINSGILLFEAAWLWQHLPSMPLRTRGEYYLPDLISHAVDEGQLVLGHPARDPAEILGINDRVQLAQAGAILRKRILERLMLGGVSVVDPATSYIEDTVEIGGDSIIEPNTHLRGSTRIGRDCTIGPNSIVVDTTIGSRCRVFASVLESATLEDDVDVGPFGHLRKGAYLCQHVHMGNFGEVKNSRLGAGVKMGHFSYVGDADIGDATNIGAGAITCNLDIHGHKNRTVVGKRAYIGSDTMLVAPVELGDGAVTGAGSVVTKDVPRDGVVYGVPARLHSAAADTKAREK